MSAEAKEMRGRSEGRRAEEKLKEWKIDTKEMHCRHHITKQKKIS